MIYRNYIVFIILVFLYTLPRYISFLPTLPVYDNTEATTVLKKRQNITSKDIDFFKLTDETITNAFIDHVNESYNELEKMITSINVLMPILFLKYLINRPRPYQIISNINPLHSNTGDTPSMPAGHAFQAYYLAHILSQRYPEKSGLFNNIAKHCDEVRVNGGIHYPSDGVLSKYVVDTLIEMGVY
tara:strand:- start:2267 stop:2824 length:558 start_codon:yes stop_codon:yes gene_type:complete